MESSICSHCGRIISDDSADGLCPSCLLRLGLEGEVEFSLVDPEQESAALSEERIGPYRIIRLLGEGGMGSVYLAEQLEPLRRQVALKIIKLGMDTREVIARFEAERRVLALMDHPNIARVLDAGASQTGRPYFVMDYVDGMAITTYCDGRKLDIEARLALFIQVCEAVQYAHQKGIIHRDLKASNVLVTTRNEKPIPKVIDFGLARATSRSPANSSFFTREMVVVGTPAYMSPEQVESDNRDVDTRTDVYSLGVLLYELIVGSLPFSAAEFQQAGLQEICRIIREEDPPSLTRRLDTLQRQELEKLVVSRSTDLGQLRRQIRGDLEWITLGAMEKDRDRRYPTVSEFVADIHRHLSGEPVNAGPPGKVYKLGKLVRKYRSPIVTVATLIVVLIVGICVSLVLFFRSEEARQQAELEAHRSKLEARAVQAALLDDPAKYMSRSREALSAHVTALSKENPEYTIHAVNRLVILDIVSLFPERPFDDTLLRRSVREAEENALEAVSRALDRGAADTDSLDLMAKYFESKDFEKAEFFCRKALDQKLKVLRKDDPELTRSSSFLVRLLQGDADEIAEEGRWSEATDHLKEALQLLVEHPVPDSYLLHRTKRLLSESLVQNGRYQEAEAVLRSSYRDCVKDFGKRSSAAITAARNLAFVYRNLNQPDRAREFEQDLPESRVTAVTEICPLSLPEHIQDRDGGYSAKFGGELVWTFADTPLKASDTSTGSWKSSTWSWTRDREPLDGIGPLDQKLDDSGSPMELLPFTEDEEYYNLANKGPDCLEECGTKWALWPGPVIPHRSGTEALIFYQKVRVSSSGFVAVGNSIAEWRNPKEQPIRPVVRPGSEEPTLLFRFPGNIAAACVVSDMIYAYFNRCDGLDCHSLLARAPYDSSLERNVWRFFGGHGRWVANPRDAHNVIDAAPTFSVHWNQYLKRFVAIYAIPFRNTIAYRTALRPEGPWSAAHEFYEGMPPLQEGENIHFALVHPELAKRGGKIQYVSYYRPLGPFRGQTRLIEVVFE